MICLLDTDILIDVAINRSPFSNYSAGVLDLAERRLFKAFVAWHSLSNFYYIVSFNRNRELAKSFIREMLCFVSVAPVSTEDALYASDLELADYEDALQVASARACRAKKIITRNVGHYKKGPVSVVEPKDFILTFAKR